MIGFGLIIVATLNAVEFVIIRRSLIERSNRLSPMPY